MDVRRVSVGEFKARCIEEIREVEKGELILEPTRHGKTGAVVHPPFAAPSAPTLGDWVGSGKGTVRFGRGSSTGSCRGNGPSPRPCRSASAPSSDGPGISGMGPGRGRLQVGCDFLSLRKEKAELMAMIGRVGELVGGTSVHLRGGLLAETSRKPHRRTMNEEISFTAECCPESGGFVACWDDPRGGGIAAQGDSLGELHAMITDPLGVYPEPREAPIRIKVHFCTDPVLLVA